MSDADSTETTKLLHMIGDFERISDHSVNLLDSLEEIHDKHLVFSKPARDELSVMINAVSEILQLALSAFCNEDIQTASLIEPLEQVVDKLQEEVKSSHILRLQKKECSIEMGFILSDILNSLERVSDHCSNIAGCLIEMSHMEMDMHNYLKGVKSGDKDFSKNYESYAQKYSLKA